MKKDLRTPLARAKGLGSAHEGNHHWMAQRISAVALVPLIIWFICRMAYFFDESWQTAVVWAATPINTTLLALLVVVSFYHGALGMQVVIEDYVHGAYAKYISLLLSRFVMVFLAAFSLVCLVKIFLLGFVI